MSASPMDDLDRLIDDVAMSMTRGEPRRVDAASIRWASGAEGTTHRSKHFWFGLAAILLLGLSLRGLMAGRANETQTPAIATSAPATAIVTPSSVLSDQAPAVSVPSPIRTARSSTQYPRALADVAINEPYAGLPRLLISPIEAPAALVTDPLEGDAGRIHPIEISLLILPALVNEEKQQ